MEIYKILNLLGVIFLSKLPKCFKDNKPVTSSRTSFIPKQPFSDVLQNKWSKTLQILLENTLPGVLFQ